MKKMSEDKKQTGAKFAGSATFTVIGTVQDIYSGKKADYVKVRTWQDDYYRDYDVTASKEYGIEQGDKLRFDGTIGVFCVEKISRYKLVLLADTVEEVEST